MINQKQNYSHILLIAIYFKFTMIILQLYFVLKSIYTIIKYKPHILDKSCNEVLAKNKRN